VLKKEKETLSCIPLKGIKRIISISKIKKSKTIKKNRKEKEIRPLELGIKPHSKIVLLLKLLFNIEPKKHRQINNKIKQMIIEKRRKKINIIIKTLTSK